jgi:hypothetical protein
LLGGTEFLDLIRTVFASGPPEVPDPIDMPDLQPEDEDRSISHPPDFQCHYIIDDRSSPDNSSEISDSSDDDDRNMSNLRTSEFPTPTVGIRFYGNHQGQIWDTNPDPSEDDDEDISGISIPDPSTGTPDVPGTLDPDVKDGKPVPVYFNYWKPISVPPKRNTRVTVKVLEYLARGAARGVYLDNIRQALRGSLTRDTTPPLDQSDDHFRANNNTGRKSVRWVSDGNANILDNVPSGSVILGMCPLPH